MRKNFILKTLTVMILLLLAAGCNPVESEEQHFEAIGLFIISSGDTTVRYQDGIVTGEIEVQQGTDTALLSVKFITEDGSIGIPPNNDWSLDWNIADTTHADVISNDDELQQYRFHIAGKLVGITTIKIIINHHGHKDFESKSIPIEVIQ